MVEGAEIQQLILPIANLQFFKRIGYAVTDKC